MKTQRNMGGFIYNVESPSMFVYAAAPEISLRYVGHNVWRIFDRDHPYDGDMTRYPSRNAAAEGLARLAQVAQDMLDSEHHKV